MYPSILLLCTVGLAVLNGRFSVCGFLLGVVSLFAGVGCFSSSSAFLKNERSEGTLPLLLITRATGFHIALASVLGSVAPFTREFFVAFPFCVAIHPLLFTDPIELFRVFLAVCNTIWLASCAGILYASVAGQGWNWLPSIRAGTVFLIVAFLAFPGSTVFTSAPQLLQHFSLSYQGRMALSGSPQFSFWISWLCIHSLGWICLKVAGMEIQLMPAVRNQCIHQSWTELWTQWTYGSMASRAARRRAMLDLNPFLWLAARNRFEPAGILLFFFLIGISPYLLSFVTFPLGLFGPLIPFLVVIVWYLVLKLMISGAASGDLFRELKNGRLSQMLAAQVTVSEIVQGQWMCLRRMFLQPVCLFLLALLLLPLYQLMLLGTGAIGSGSSAGISFATRIEICFAMGIVFIADIWAIAWVAMWSALTQASDEHARSAATIRIVIFPLPIFLGVLAVISFATTSTPPFFNGHFFLALWVVISVINDFLHVRWARTKLVEQTEICVFSKVA